MSDKKSYKCSVCDFQWQNIRKEYKTCPDCGSEEIFLVETSKKAANRIQEGEIGIRSTYGRGGRGAGPPRVCKCPKCGYEISKTPSVPCRNNKCPECGTPLCGAD